MEREEVATRSCHALRAAAPNDVVEGYVSVSNMSRSRDSRNK
jgi:hypothetical protein